MHDNLKVGGFLHVEVHLHQETLYMKRGILLPQPLKGKASESTETLVYDPHEDERVSTAKQVSVASQTTT